RELMAHPIYARVRGANDARFFMAHHVFAVYDFMSLLKALQTRLTCVSVPWIPPDNTRAARLINEIVLGEETDEDGEGEYIGHYDLYREAMRAVGADPRPIARLVNSLKVGRTLEEGLVTARAPACSAEFVRTTIDIATYGKTHEIAAAFF